jgi:hypothetical protein
MRSTVMRLPDRVACMVERNNAFSISVGKSERKPLVEKYKCRWNVNIKVDLMSVRGGNMH